MNLWIVRISPEPFSATEAARIESIAEGCRMLQQRSRFDFHSDKVHYLSYSSPSASETFRYHHVENDELFTFCGTPFSLLGETNYRDASALQQHWEHLKGGINGSWAAVRISGNQVSCIGDTCGDYKIYYATDPRTGSRYLSNDFAAILALKGRHPNLSWFGSRLALGFTLGYDTADADIAVLPERSELTMSPQRTRVSSYMNVDAYLPREPYPVCLERAAAEFRSMASESLRHFDVVVPLSGGVDSRFLCLVAAEAATHPGAFKTYTYNSGLGRRDINIAAQIARTCKTRHTKIWPERHPLPTLDAFLQQSEREHTPLLSLGFILNRQIGKESAELFTGPDPLCISGRLGGIEPLSRLTLAHQGMASEEKLMRYLLLPGYTVAEFEAELVDSGKRFLREKYAALAPDSLGEIYFMLEYIRNGDHHLLAANHHTLFPFFNSSFVQMVFSAPVGRRFKNTSDSIFGDLSRLFTQGSPPNVPFTNYYQWDSGRAASRLLQLRWQIRKKLGLRCNAETKLRKRFIIQNLPAIKTYLSSRLDSELFAYVNRDRVVRALADDALLLQDSPFFSDLLPFLHFLEGAEI